jgi:hypothetical protein
VEEGEEEGDMEEEAIRTIQDELLHQVLWFLLQAQQLKVVLRMLPLQGLVIILLLLLQHQQVEDNSVHQLLMYH